MPYIAQKAASVDLTAPGPIGGTTPAAGSFTALSSALGTITADQQNWSGTATWNNAAVTFTGLELNITDTASAAGSLLMDLQVGGVSKFKVDTLGQVYFLGGTSLYIDQFGRLSGAYSRFTGNVCRINALEIGNADDTVLVRDAAGTLAQRNGVNAQTFRLYNTYTDASNYERAFMRWNTNVLEIGAEAAGTGTARNVKLSGANRSAYIASPTAAEIRDILISHGLMAAA